MKAESKGSKERSTFPIPLQDIYTQHLEPEQPLYEY